MKKKVLICGASGFIGYNLFQTLSQRPDLEVFGTYLTNAHKRIDTNNNKLIKADLTDKERIDALTRGVDIMIQAAAVTSGAKDIVEKPYLHVTDNAIMNSLLFRSAYDNGVAHVIFFSCTVLYPPGHRPLKEPEVDLNAELGKYFGAGWTKIYLEKQCEFYARLGGNKYTIIRHSNVYGPHDKFDLERSHVCGATITKVLNSDNGQVNIWGTGEEKRDLLYIDDLTKFVELAADRQETSFEIFNVGLGKTISVRELVEKIILLSGQNLRISRDLSKPTIDSSITIDISKAKEKLGWEPRIDLNEGIAGTIEWYRKTRAA